ncbi:hypothetical protein RRG08_053873 [Elysia crispata]|uniref:Sulfotransferase n=1 Tax=Elysia crispata TaxID=231223 RepID=A0AAE1D0V0_9GAST|nr:hypothetical protein RRG08_053873 [Elysia crispata]
MISPLKNIRQKFLFVFMLTLVFLAVTFLYPSERIANIGDRPYKEITRANNNERQRRDQVQTLLVTFGRSGSSFTSDIIAHNKEVFYTFEPLSFLSRPNEAKRVPAHFKTSDLEDFSKRVIKSYLSCSFDFDTFNSLANFHLTITNSTKQFAECFQKQKPGIDHLDCYFKFLETCESHRMTFVKTIRFPVKWALDLMVSYPNLKLIYLVRDPRATLYSQAKVFKLFNLSTDVANFSASHCSRLDEDLKDLLLLRDMFPGRVKVVRYENAATDPRGFTLDIYRFLELPITEDLLSFVKTLTTPTTDHVNHPQLNKINGITHLQNKKVKRVINMHKGRMIRGVRIKRDISPRHEKMKPDTNAGRDKMTLYTNDGRGKMKPDTNDGRYKMKPNTDAGRDKMKPDTNTGRDKMKPDNSHRRNNLVNNEAKRKVKYYNPYSTHRDDPMSVMDHWRQVIGIKATWVIDNHCGHLYKQLGYRAASSQKDLENIAQISLVDYPQVEGIL